MDALKAQLLRVQEQLNGLSLSQKMLTASLVAIMVMTIGWWARYAGTSEMESVLTQPLSQMEMGQIKATLDARGIPAKIVGEQVMVPSDRKIEAMAQLAYNNSLPSNSDAAWDDMTKQMSLWDSSSKTETIYNHMKERMLGEMITAYFPGVAKADVLINVVADRKIGGSMQPSASVMISTRGQDANIRKLVPAAAATVASAVPGLQRSRVTVVVDGITRPTQDQNTDLGGADQYDQQLELEKSKVATLQGILPQNSLIAVSVQLDPSRKESTHEKFNQAESIIKDTQITNESHENTQPQPTAAEPGVGSNQPLALGGQAGAPSAASNVTDKSQISTTILPGRLIEKIQTPAGTATVVSAAITIPRSYFAKVLKAKDPSKEPDETTILAAATREFDKYKQQAQFALGMKSAEMISVEMYYDMDTAMLGSISQAPASASAGVSSMISGHAREMALGTLAIISLFMVSMIVKKGGPVVAVAAPAVAKETPRLNSGEVVAGIVGDNHAMLDGLELDENTVKAQQVVEQVSTMVKENPDAAASLVKRWMNRS